MAPPGRKPGGDQSVLDGLKTVYTDLSNLQFAPDAAQHQQFIGQLQQVIVKYVQQAQQQKAQQAAQLQQLQAQRAINPQMGGPNSGGPPPGAGGPPGGAPPGAPGGPPSQGSPGIAMPNPDELRRVLAGAEGL